jgi:hypothetical protein
MQPHRWLSGALFELPKEVTVFVIARCVQRAVAIQLDCFVVALLAMTGRRHFFR